MDDSCKTKDQLIEELAALRNRLKDENRASEVSYRSLVEQLPPDTLVYKAALDDITSTIYISPQVEMLGYSQQEWTQARDMWSRSVHPDDRDRVMAEFRRRRIDGRSLVCEYRMITRDNKVLWFRDHAVLIRDADGSPLFFQGLMIDITERMNSEKALIDALTLNQTILDKSPAGILIYLASGPGVMANGTAAAIIGGSREQLIEQNFHEIRSWKESGLYEAACQAVASGGVVRHEAELLTSFGRHIWIGATFSTFNWGEQRHLALLFTDITQRKTAEEEKAKLEAQLRQAQKLETIGTLAGGIAHDFNNLLQPLGSCADLMKSQLPPDSPLLNYVDLVSRAVVRGRDLVKQMLTFSRQREHDRRPLRMDALVLEVLSLIRAGLPDTVEIEEHIESTPEAVLADPVHMQQILMNLCTNACDAMEGRGILEISLSCVDLAESTHNGLARLRPGKHIRLSVRDSGSGMDKDTVKRIFDPFFTTKEVGKGTGLGLAVVYGIVMEHEGDIVVESVPGKGSSFHVYLPCVEDAAAVEQAAEKVPIPRGKCSVLLVDDDPDVVWIAKDVLEYLGYRVDDCTRPAEAIERFRQDPDGYDVALTDYSMPRMTGIELSLELRNVRPDIPVIIMTGNDQAIDDAALKQASISAVISKPFDSAAIAATIQRVAGMEKTD